jgi:PAS domain S-box-containing protein
LELRGLLSNLQLRVKSIFWPTVLIAILVVRALVSFSAKPDSPLLAYGGISYFLLLLIATGFVLSNAIQNTLGSRRFWVLLAIGYSLWALDQWIFLYHEFFLHTEVPDNSIADPLLFLHIVPFTAAVASLLTLRGNAPRLYHVISNFLLLLFFWGLLYFYAVFPYQYLFSNPASYALRFDILYLVENLVLIAVVGILSLRAQYPWKMIYLHLLGASALYALSSGVANTAIDSGGYVYGKIYGLGLTASACWFVWVPLRARQITKAEMKAGRLTSEGSQLPAWAMLVMLVISVPLVWELLKNDETAGMRKFRLIAAIAAILCLTTIAFIKEHFAKSELIAQLSLANDRLRLAVEASKSMGWEWDLKTGRLSWFGDLRNVFGIASDSFVGQREDLYRYVHPEDHELVRKAVDEARQSRKPYAAEFRVIRVDGTVGWITSRGQFYYGNRNDPQRMLGMARDITRRRQGQESLRLFRRLIDQTNDAIEVVDPETLRFLDVNDKCCRDLGYTRDELLSLNAKDTDPMVNDESMVSIGERIDQSGFVIFESLRRRKDGSTYPVEINLKRVQLERAYLVNVVRDITERKRVEESLRQKSEALAGLSGKLIEAQEQERRRIARELHDDIGQRLALLSIELTQLRQSYPTPSEFPGRIDRLQKQTSGIASDVQSLSHELHSSRLQYLGLAAALGGFCQEFSSQQKVEIDFSTHDLPTSLASEFSLCFFRVLQEGLRNAAKHSGVRAFEVRLWGTPGEIHLTIRDKGVGFDVEAVRASRGLGLISMQERLKLLHGTLSIESQLQQGTTIHASLPHGSDIQH